MRKLLLLCAMLLCVKGVWAQTFVEPQTGRCYKLKGDNTQKPWLTKQLSSKSIVVSAEESDAAIFMKTETGLMEVTTGKYIGKDGDYVSLVNTEHRVTIGDYNDANATGNGIKYSVKVIDNYMYNNNTDGKTHESSKWMTTIERYWGFVEQPHVTALADWDNNWSFKIYGYRGFIYATEAGELKGTNVASVSFNSSSDYHHFALVKYDDKYYLYNIGAKKFVVRHGSNGVALSEQPTDAISISAATGSTTAFNWWLMELDGVKVNLSNGDGHTYGIRCADGTEDEGMRWAFCMTKTYDASEVEAKVAAYVNNITNTNQLSNNAFYKVYGERGFIYATETGELKGTNIASTTYDPANPYHHFAILKYGENYYLYNVGAKKFVVKNGTSASLSDTPSHTLTLGAATDQSTDYDWLIRLNGSLTHLSNNAGNGVYTNHNGQDEGTRWAIYKSGNFSPEYPLFEIKKHVESLTLPFTISSATEINPFVIAIDNDVKKSFVAQKLTSSAERYVRITGADEEPELGYGQWAIYPAVAGNKIGFKIKNIATETYIYAKPGVANEEYPVVLNGEGTVFDFTNSMFAYTDGANTLYLSVPANDSYDLPLGVGTEADETRKTIAFPEFSSFQVTIGEVGYTTLYSPFTVFAFPEEGKEVDIYAITDSTTSENNKVTLTKLESWNVIPANQGCILKGSGKITFSKTDDTWVSGDWSTNLLRGSFTNTYVQGDAYVLSAPDGVESVGLYKALLNKDANGEAGTSHFKNNAGKAYLPASALSAEAAESRFFLFGFGDGEETGITETENGKVKTENAEVYDLAGRRVQGAQKGIFIVNGKKVVR